MEPFELIKETEDLYDKIIKDKYFHSQIINIERFVNNYHNLLINMNTNSDKYNDLLLKFLSNEYLLFDDDNYEGIVISKDDIHIYNFLNSDDIILKILEILLMLPHYVNKVLEILDTKLIHAIVFSNLTMLDVDYIPYITKYLNKLIEFKTNYNKEYISNLYEYIYNKDDIIDIMDFDYRKVIDEKLDEKAHYILAQIRRNNNNLSDIDKDYIMEHLLQSGDYADSKSLRTKLYQIYYLNEEPMITKSKFDLNFDVKTILNLINNNK